MFRLLFISLLTIVPTAGAMATDAKPLDKALSELASREYPKSWQNELLAIQLTWAAHLGREEIDPSTTASFTHPD